MRLLFLQVLISARINRSCVLSLSSRGIWKLYCNLIWSLTLHTISEGQVTFTFAEVCRRPKAVDDFFCNVFLSTALKSLLNINIFPAVTLLTRIIIASQQRSRHRRLNISQSLSTSWAPLPKRGYALFYIFSYSSHLSYHGSHFCPLMMTNKCQNRRFPESVEDSQAACTLV